MNDPVKIPDKCDYTYQDIALGTFGADVRKNLHRLVDWRVANIICEETAMGLSIQEIWRRHRGEKGWPGSESKHFMWMRFSETYRNMYHLSQEDRSELHIERMLDLMDKVADGKMGVNEARLISENLRWAAGKFNVKRYGEKQQKDEGPQKTIVFNFNLKGEEKEAPKVIEATVRPVLDALPISED